MKLITGSRGWPWMLRAAGILLLFLPLEAAAMRCNGGLVDTGDWAVEVRELCGEPDYISRFPGEVVPHVGYVKLVEHWYYNRGSNRFIRRLVFRDGVLRRIDTQGYGFPSNAEGHCAPTDINDGMSEYELFKRCGEPLSRRTWWAKSRLRPGTHHYVQVFPVEEWLYDFGRTRFRRVVRLENGLVVDLERRDKPH